jgi:hypothetical protein
MRQGQRDRFDPVLCEHRSGAGTQDRCGRPVRIARDREICGIDLAQGGFAREQLDAGFLGREARGKAPDAARSFAAVDKLLRGEESAQLGGRCFGEQALDARDLDRVDAAARRAGGSCRGGVRHAAAVPLARGAQQERRVRSRKTTAQNQDHVAAR